MKKEIIKVVSATALCLGLFGAGFLGINNLVLASATEGVQPIQLVEAAVNIPVANVALQVSEENQKPEMALSVIFYSSAMPSMNAMSYEAAAEAGAQYIWEMFGESIDGNMVHMTYSNHPASIRSLWIGRVLKPDTFLPTRIAMDQDTSIDERLHLHASTLFTFSIDAVTGERIDILTYSHWMQPSEEVRTALDELHSRSQGRATEESIAIRDGGAPPAQLDNYIEAAREFAQRHFSTTEVVSTELVNINAIAFDLDENGNLFATNRQLIFEVTDSTGRVADVAIVESTKQLIWLNTGMNDIVPGCNYVGAEPGIG